tara:strand:- start:56 stop:250 length:195 start_codon:yes stop_codon:yes gene_type:complete
MRGVHWFFILVSLILATYMVNITFEFIKIPEMILDIEKWIFFAGALVILWLTSSYYKAKSLGGF